MEPTYAMAAKVRNFPDIMEEFKNEFPTEPEGRVEKGSSIRSKISWREVLVVLDDAAAAYATKTGVKGALKRVKGFIEDRGDTIERLSRLVPDVDYAKPIVGTLTFLLQAFKQTSKVRQEVNDGVERLGNNFELVEAYIEMYSAKLKVVEAAMTLYVTILRAIEEVIGYYTKHMVIKGFKAVWNGEKYEESLLSCLENITNVSRELIGQADTAHKQVTNKVAVDVEIGFKDVEIWVERAEKNLKEGLNAMFKDHITAMEARHEKEKELLRHESEKKDAELARLEQLYYRAITPEPPHVAECIVKQEDLLQFLDLTDVETTDIEYIIQQRELIISRGQDRTEQIMKSTQLREWLVQANSKELLIHGSCEPLPISPISFFCAMLTQNLRGVERFKSLAFFCGCHPYEDYGGARTLIISLLAQLLKQQHFDLSFIDHEIACRMDDGDIQAFCYVFERLLEQVNMTETVFCIIDGINFYECNGDEPLREMATEDVRQAIRDEDYLALPELAANTLSFSKARFERQWEEGHEAE
ncbi:hypothetical protein E0Z10_g8053 [Xylaria hypoxylon]|uniref:Fungal STAND N-terminal Goodbye domain-containing protein n=1 Tax=Xylaria hypoxylon TaxID=37992 RepID=A0A4Z0YQI6_9PEZI|nr:hypothetical protein E0Z10_g8053 [Xylaria hypoxylon]